MDTTQTAPAIGTRFTSTESRNYTLPTGERGTHTCTLLNEVIALTAKSLEYRVIEVVAETGRPPFATTPAGGTMAAFGWYAALAKGRVEVVR